MGNTADAEFIMNSSLYSPKGQAASVAYVGKAIPALPRLLGQQGYDTFTMHQNTAAYWNRKELYATLGFSRYYDSGFFRWADKFDRKGSSDELLFKKGGDLLRQVDASSTPFYAQLITLSAHSPFDLIPQARRPIKTPKDLKGSLMGDYITSENYTDFALGKFITQLKADGIWDDSIIVIYGDHTSMNENKLSGKDARAAKQLLGRSYSAADRQRVPLIIHLPGQTESQAGDGDGRAGRHHADHRRPGRARSARHAAHGPELVRELECARPDCVRTCPAAPSPTTRLCSCRGWDTKTAGRSASIPEPAWARPSESARTWRAHPNSQRYLTSGFWGCLSARTRRPSS